MTSTARYVFVVEDPGAANFAAPAVEALAAAGEDVRVYGAGAGADQLGRLGIRCTPLPAGDPSDPAFAAQVLAPDTALLAIGTSEDPGAAGLALVAAARARGIASVGLVDGPANAARRFRGHGAKPLAFAPDRILVPDPATAEEFVRLGHAAGRVLAVGHPHFDTVRAARRRLDAGARPAMRRAICPDLGSEAPLVVFLAERSDGLDAAAFRRSADYTLHGDGGSERRTDIVLEEVIGALREVAPEAGLVLRLHPKNTADELDRFRSRVGAVSRDEPTLDVLWASDLVIGMTTVALAEALVLGRRVLSVVPREEERRWLFACPDHLLPCAWTRESVRERLAALLASPAPDRDEVDAWFPPAATRRAVEALRAFAAEPA